MGLTIHWTLQAPDGTSDVQAAELVAQLRSGFLDLPFDHVGEITHFSAEEIHAQLEDRESPNRWLLILSEAKVKLGNDPEVYDYVRVEPVEVVGFVADPGDESEPVCLFLARYPQTTVVNGRKVETWLKGWQGSAFCKTQYGGIISNEHFLKCHLTVIAALDLARSLGLKVEVIDEGGYWENRNVDALLKELRIWNESIAAFVGALGDAHGGDFQSPIKDHPEFERLEHFGTTGQTAAFVKALAEVLKREKQS